MAKFLCLILLATISCSLQTEKTGNSTCVKSMKTMETTYVRTICKTTKPTWIFFRKTAYKSCTKMMTSYKIEKFNVCCPGYVNISGQCQTAPCSVSHYGNNCSLSCPCVKNQYESCDDHGTCLCSPGWTGKNCSQACEQGKYGEGCKQKCTCQNNATCDHMTGKCDCSRVVGKTGDHCDEDCPPRFFGLNCSLSCNCSQFQNPVCNPQTGTCTCQSGKTGHNCYEDCRNNTFGPNCAESCECVAENSLGCNSSSGVCDCKAGWIGSSCERRCDPYHFGKGCEENCSCQSTEVCDNENGTCFPANVCLARNTLNCLPSLSLTCQQVSENCTHGDIQKPSLKNDMLDICCGGASNFTDSICIARDDCVCKTNYGGFACIACEQGKYGEGCKQKCTCQNNATCDHVTGKCDCSRVVGKTGDHCDEDCPLRFYGLNCSLSCNCSQFQNPVCNPQTGTCTCQSGKTGHNCYEDCRNYTFGPNCAESCECVAENSLGCNSSSGVCDCKAGWIGSSCERRCDPYHFGKGCEENCSCQSTEVCDNENGTCFPANVCLARNTLNCLPSLTLTCQQVSENCTHGDTQKPSLKNDMLDICCGDSSKLIESICITRHDCDCKNDYGGFACIACEQGKYGEGCKQKCTCQNNATCDHVTGKCDCSRVVGKTGDHCDEDCPPRFYGLNCSSSCNCSQFQNPVCNPQTGTCTCQSGKTGHNCYEDCRNYTFGPNCAESCECVAENSLGCNSSSGVCDCKAGWNGSSCERRCDPYHFGKGCEENCSCQSTEVCDNEHGRCFPANVCLARNTLNCLPSLTLTCQQVSENCTHGDTQKPSLKNDMLDICCGDSSKLIESICITRHDCDCKNDYGGFACIACEQGKYGEGCKQKCTCQNNATCDHVTGKCDCSRVVGKTGDHCDEDCPPRFYGLNCSSSCNCSQFQNPVCNPQTGTCTCQSGKTGHNCYEDCRNYTFGPNCAESCECVAENSLGCNSSSGVCDCKAGWNGSSCERRCDPYHFGKGCEENCSCQSTEVCDNEHGRCFPANVCLARNTLNCLPSLTLTCQQVSENCTHGDTQKPSLKNDMLDICCGDSSKLIESICITRHDCDCKNDYGGFACIACEQGKYGEGCKQKCTCQNNATCDHVTGKCDCSRVVGKTGDHCDEDCPPRFYGLNCSSSCNCSQFQNPVCNPQTGTCTCQSGKTGHNCYEDCRNYTFGPNCAESCECVAENSLGCNSSSGVCDCKAGWNGSSCERRCDPYHFGKGCEENCSCQSTEVCDNEHGRCFPANVCLARNTLNCLPSLTLTCQQVSENCTHGDTQKPSLKNDMLDICCGDSSKLIESICITRHDCDCKNDYGGFACIACEQGKYGEGCKQKCTCQNNATCDHVTGKCDCSRVVGKTGDHCDEDCPPRFYGLNCSSSCNCSQFQNPVCNPQTGTCTCQSGKTGHNCYEDCRNYTFGPNCAESCECVAENSLGCNSSSGVCDCKAGWNGSSCERRCDPYHFGKGCEENCSCQSTEVCDNEHGRCFPANVCLARNTLNCLPSLTLTCQQVSENCTHGDTQKPSLKNDMLDICCGDSSKLIESICITRHDCDCKNDYGGFACIACEQGKYGEGCKQKCTCQNNATCDHVTGKCDCSRVVGKTGDHCDEDCPPRFYGLNCSSSCNCSQFQNPVCNPQTGTCTCQSGKTGHNCYEDCRNYTFGPNCAESCECVAENSLGCNSSSGVCDCKAGWNGSSCERRCDPYHFGKGCEENCSCQSTEVCDNEHGRCFPANVCLARNTLNCLPSLTLTCQQVSENCTHGDTQKPSLKNDMLDICCGDSSKLIESICITRHDCDCKNDYGGFACIACEQGKYGEECKHECTCQNNATCDHVTGKCDCSRVVGKTGDHCDEDCPPRFYGLNCSSSCSCSQFQNPVCNPKTGTCTCQSGKTGNNCYEDCRNNTFGPNCAESCKCVAENSLGCNSSSGVCDCKAGWIGSSCERRCDPYHFGKGCEENCSCQNTEVCDNENGTCFPANVCLARNTLNCLTSLILTCKQVSENCTHGDTQKLSLKKDMLGLSLKIHFM
uniref:Multiple epidermal growth factor-like domains protein 6 isoform X3 n=1 Tax=Crassostrea virginica TaxID=6565 RepID=A0A8B8A937_CRAVI|nr:multiple epidermal growth factor-like domains protein 6 isoform X3 [Crassostrea virginica]